MSKKQFLALPVTGDTFAEIREKNRYYVDKTPYLKQVFSEDESVDENSLIDGTTVLLLTRPRRFGKTLLMTMFESFLKISSKNPGDTTIHQSYFNDTKIFEDKEFCKKYMGQFPVIAITLKDVLGDSYEDTYFQLAGIIADKVNEFGFLKDSPALNENDKDTFSKLSNKNFLVTSSAQSRYYITQAIASLSLMLYKHFKKQVYVLIDEYDVPLAKAHAKGYHEKMVSLMSSFLGFLKDPKRDPEKNTSIISKVVITGCLKVAKNSIFTGVNNLYVNTVVDQETEYTGIIGFTKEETQKVLKDYEFDDFSTTVKNYYDGYKFFDKEMFCPWDVINFVRKNFNFKQTGNLDNIKPGNYWDKSSSDSALEEYLGYLTDNDNQKMQDLVDGKSISFKLNESMNYDTLSEHKSNDFWSLLLHTGYLTVDWELTKKEELAKENNKDIFVRIPNLEILECFENNILERFGKILNKDNLALNIAHALLDGNVDFVQNKLGLLLCSFVSIRDTATRAPHENYYHGFLNGIFTNCKDNLGEYHSNIESGDGYPDIILKGTDFRKVAIIEIKSAPIGSDIETLSEKAISQIEDKNYAEPLMTNKTVKSVYGYGITFAGKSCAISVKKLK